MLEADVTAMMPGFCTWSIPCLSRATSNYQVTRPDSHVSSTRGWFYSSLPQNGVACLSTSFKFGFPVQAAVPIRTYLPGSPMALPYMIQAPRPTWETPHWGLFTRVAQPPAPGAPARGPHGRWAVPCPGRGRLVAMLGPGLMAHGALPLGFSRTRTLPRPPWNVGLQVPCMAPVGNEAGL